VSGTDGTATAGQDVFAGTIAELTWHQVDQAARSGAIVLWAFGVIEQHGPHLPCGTDVYLPMAWIRAVRAELRSLGVDAVIMPPYYWGVNVVSAAFPGSYSVRPEVMQHLVADLASGLAHDGFSHVFCFSGHGDALHNQTVYRAADLATQLAKIDVSFVAASNLVERIGLDVRDRQLTVYEPSDGAVPPDRFVDVHAGGWETSQMLSVCPQLVDDRARAALPPTEYGPEELALWRRGLFEARRLTPDGYLGDPAGATAERGARDLQRQARSAAAAIAERVARLAPGDPARAG
jgi:creatinine amidohydrolase